MRRGPARTLRSARERDLSPAVQVVLRPACAARHREGSGGGRVCRARPKSPTGSGPRRANARACPTHRTRRRRRRSASDWATVKELAFAEARERDYRLGHLLGGASDDQELTDEEGDRRAARRRRRPARGLPDAGRLPTGARSGSGFPRTCCDIPAQPCASRCDRSHMGPPIAALVGDDISVPTATTFPRPTRVSLITTVS
jgi:hypothetical protein